MKKSFSKLMIFAFFVFFSFMGVTFAREMTFEELKSVLEEKDPDMNSFYMIGHYIFTDQMILSSRDIMLSSTSIDVSEQNKDGKTDKDGIYQEMAIYYFEKDIQTSDWKDVAVNVLTQEQKTLKSDDKFNVQYINYEMQAEKSEAEIVLDVDKTEYNTYSEILKSMLKFETKDSYGDEKVELKNGVVSGLLLKNDKITLSEEDKKKYNNPVYFFAYILEIPGASAKTEITVDGIHGSGTIEWDDFDVQDSNKTPGVVVLVPIQPDEWKDHKTIVLTIDLDGSEEEEYEATEYTIDLSGLRFQDDSKATVTDSESDISETNKKQIEEEWGYHILTGADKKYTFKQDDTDTHKYNLTGKVELQHTNHGIFAKEGEDGYYFLFNLKKPEELEEVPEGVTLTLTGQKTFTFGKEDFDESGVFTNLFKLNNTDCNEPNKTNCSFEVTIDWDGNGKEYLPTKFTVDYSTLTFVKGSPFTIEGVNGEEEDAASTKLKEQYGWKKVDGFNTSFKTEDQIIKVSGLIPILDEFESSKHPFTGDKATGYYLPFVIKTNIDKITTGSKTTIKITRGNETKTVTDEVFDENNKAYALAYLDKNAEDKTITIEVDMDGEGEEYTPYTLTLDWSDLKLQEKTVESIDVNKASDADKQGLEKYGYQSSANSNMKIEKTSGTGQEDGNYSVSGKLTQQVLNNGVFKENTGYYFDFTFQLPEDVDLSEVEISHLTEGKLEANGDSVKKKFKATEYDEASHTLTILYQFKEDPQCKSNGDNCKIYYRVDYDGEEKEYLPTLVTIDYSKLTFEKSSIFTVAGLETDGDYDFEDDGWLTKDGYSIQVEVDPKDNHKYLVKGILPIFEDTEWSGSDGDPLKSPNNDYYLGLLLTLADKQIQDSNEGSINVKFFHDDEDDTHFVKVFDSDFNNTKELYIMKYLVPSDETKEFTITVDLDGDDKEEYAPYTVTIDYSGVVFQNYSLSNVDFDVLTEVTKDSPEDKELTKYHFDSKTVSEVTTHENTDQPERPSYKDGLSGKIKEQTLDAASGYGTLSGYFVPVKISFPTDPELQAYKEKWTITLYDESGSELPAYTPTSAEYQQGWVMVLFKVKDNHNPIKYEMDFDGTGDAFLPSSYKIKTEDLEFQTENKITFEYFDETSGTVLTKEETVYQGDKIDSSIAPELGKYTYHKFDYWYEDGKDTNTSFAFGTDSTDKDEDITLKAHYTLDMDKFLIDVVADLNNKDSDISEDFTSMFDVKKDNNTITFTVLDSTTKLSDMNRTSIPGTIAYILQRGEVKDITLMFKGKQVVFKKGEVSGVQPISLDPEISNLKEQVQAGAKALFKEVLSDEEETMTLNKMAVAGDTFTLKIGELADTVKLDDEAQTEYKFQFETEIALVSNENELEQALKNDLIKTIEITSDFGITKVHNVTRKDVTIKSSSDGAKTLTSNSELESIFNVSGQNVTIENIKLKGQSKTAIVVGSTASVNVNNVDFTGIASQGSEGAAIEVKASGTITGENLTYDDEKYMKPLVKAEEKATVNITSSEKPLQPITVEEIIPYSGSKETFTSYQIGETKQKKADYNYKHYFLKSEVANRWIKVTYVANRAVTRYPLSYILYHDKETGTEYLREPEGIKYINSFDTANITYTLYRWGGNGNSYSKGQIPVKEITSDEISFGAEYKEAYKEHVQEVSDENGLKQALENPDIKTIVVTTEITLASQLDITKEGVVITGSKSGSTDIVGTLKGTIKVSAQKVVFDQLKVVGNGTDSQYVVEIVGKDFDSSQVQYSIESGNFDSILYYNVVDPDTALFYNTFNGQGHTSTYVKFAQEVDGNVQTGDTIKQGTSITGSTVIDSESKAVTFLEMKDIKGSTVLNIRQTDQQFKHNDSKLLKVNARPSGSNVTIAFSSLWTTRGTQKKVKIEVDNLTQEDASGITIEKKTGTTELDVSYTNSTPSQDQQVKIVDK